MMVLDFSQVAIFILSTTVINRHAKQEYPTYYESRLLPLRETWTSFFPHTYFVFGTNNFDYMFLQRRCRTQQGQNGRNRRRLAPNHKQELPRQESEVYYCDPASTEGKWHIKKSLEDRSKEHEKDCQKADEEYEGFQRNRAAPFKVLYTVR